MCGQARSETIYEGIPEGEFRNFMAQARGDLSCQIFCEMTYYITLQPVCKLLSNRKTSDLEDGLFLGNEIFQVSKMYGCHIRESCHNCYWSIITEISADVLALYYR